MARFDMITRFLTAALLVVFAVGSTACSSQARQKVPSAEVERNWDKLRPTEHEAQLRNRLAHTQRDH